MSKTVLNGGNLTFVENCQSDGETNSDTINDFSEYSENGNIKIFLEETPTNKTKIPITVDHSNTQSKHFTDTLNLNHVKNESSFESEDEDDSKFEITKRTTIRKIISRTTSINGVEKETEVQEFLIKDSHVNDMFDLKKKDDKINFRNSAKESNHSVKKTATDKGPKRNHSSNVSQRLTDENNYFKKDLEKINDDYEEINAINSDRIDYTEPLSFISLDETVEKDEDIKISHSNVGKMFKDSACDGVADQKSEVKTKKHINNNNINEEQKLSNLLNSPRAINVTGSYTTSQDYDDDGKDIRKEKGKEQEDNYDLKIYKMLQDENIGKNENDFTYFAKSKTGNKNISNIYKKHDQYGIEDSNDNEQRYDNEKEKNNLRFQENDNNGIIYKTSSEKINENNHQDFVYEKNEIETLNDVSNNSDTIDYIEPKKNLYDLKMSKSPSNGMSDEEYDDENDFIEYYKDKFSYTDNNKKMSKDISSTHENHNDSKLYRQLSDELNEKDNDLTIKMSLSGNNSKEEKYISEFPNTFKDLEINQRYTDEIIERDKDSYDSGPINYPGTSWYTDNNNSTVNGQSKIKRNDEHRNNGYKMKICYNENNLGQNDLPFSNYNNHYLNEKDQNNDDKYRKTSNPMMERFDTNLFKRFDDKEMMREDEENRKRNSNYGDDKSKKSKGFIIPRSNFKERSNDNVRDDHDVKMSRTKENHLQITPPNELIKRGKNSETKLASNEKVYDIVKNKRNNDTKYNDHLTKKKSKSQNKDVRNNNPNEMSSMKWVDPLKSYHLKYDIKNNENNINRAKRKKEELLEMPTSGQQSKILLNKESNYKTEKPQIKSKSFLINDIKQNIILGGKKDNLYRHPYTAQLNSSYNRRESPKTCDLKFIRSRHTDDINPYIPQSYKQNNDFKISKRIDSAKNHESKPFSQLLTISKNTPTMLRRFNSFDGINTIRDSFSSQGIDSYQQVATILNKVDSLEKHLTKSTHSLPHNCPDYVVHFCGHCCHTQRCCEHSRQEKHLKSSPIPRLHWIPTKMSYNASTDKLNIKNESASNGMSKSIVTMSMDKKPISILDKRITNLEERLYNLKKDLKEFKTSETTSSESKINVKFQCRNIERQLELLYESIHQIRGAS